jgi:Mur ligase middle domain
LISARTLARAYSLQRSTQRWPHGQTAVEVVAACIGTVAVEVDADRTTARAARTAAMLVAERRQTCRLEGAVVMRRTYHAARAERMRSSVAARPVGTAGQTVPGRVFPRGARERSELSRARVAGLLNITADHLDRHADFAEYRDAKARLFAAQRPDDCRRTRPAA